MKKILLTILVTIGLSNFFSCCDPPLKKCFLRYKKFETKLLDNVKTVCNVTNRDSLKYDNFGIRVRLEKYLLSNNSIVGSFSNNLYAFQCADSEWGVDSKIKSINITSIDSFDNTHGQNSDVTSYFLYISTSGVRDSLLVNCSNCFDPLTTFNSYAVLGEEGYYNHNFEEPWLIEATAPVVLVLALNKKPPNIDNYRFIVNVSLYDNTIFVDTTKAVTLF